MCSSTTSPTCAAPPTRLAGDNLLAERIAPERIEVTGNTIVEAAAGALPDTREQTRILDTLDLAPGGFVLATIHRPENADNPVNLAAILRQLAASPMPVVFPQHPRTRRNIRTFRLDHLASQLRLTEPLDYPVLLTLIRQAAGLVTDSGGIQEEATILKRPILVIRRSNERPEVEQAFGRRTHPSDEEISWTLATWLRDAPAINARLADLPTPFGDGTASSRVVQVLRSRVRRQPPTALHPGTRGVETSPQATSAHPVRWRDDRVVNGEHRTGTRVVGKDPTRSRTL